MGKTVKISPIKKGANPNSDIQTMDSSLAQRNLTRTPGTGVFKFPYKETSGKYRTGLDEDAAYIKRIADSVEREVEIEKIRNWRKKLCETFHLKDEDLGPYGKFWNYTLYREGMDEMHVTPVKLLDQDNSFDLDNPRQLVAFAWLRVHPTIASSFQAYERGEFGPDVQFYVADDEVDNAVMFKKKQLVNKAIAELDGMTPTKRKRVARLLGLSVSDDAKEETVYNLIDNMIKDTEIKTGQYKGTNPINLFNRFAHMEEQLLEVSDLVEQAVIHSVYRTKNNGKVYDGEIKIAESKNEHIQFLIDEDNQQDLIALKDRVKSKKLAATE